MNAESGTEKLKVAGVCVIADAGAARVMTEGSCERRGAEGTETEAEWPER